MVKKGELDTPIIALPYATRSLKTFVFWQEDFYIVAHREESFSKEHEVCAEDIKLSRPLLL